MGADRIDLAGGHGSFVLTPFLALTPAVVASEALRRWRQRRQLSLPATGWWYLLLSGALLSLVFSSAFVAEAFTDSAARGVLLALDLLGAFTVAALVRDRTDLLRIAAAAATTALALYIAFDVAETLWWIGRFPETMRVGPALLHFGDLQNAGPIPRLGGPVDDANRGGFVLLFLAFVIHFGESRRGRRRAALTLATLLFAATISRSAGLGGLTALAVMALAGKARIPPRAALATGLVTALVLCAFLVEPRPFEQAASTLEGPLLTRLSLGEGSRMSHGAVLERGL